MRTNFQTDVVAMRLAATAALATAIAPLTWAQVAIVVGLVAAHLVSEDIARKEIPVSTPEPTEKFAGDEKIGAAEVLTPQQLRAYTMYRDGGSITWISNRLGVSPAAARQLIARAQRALGYKTGYKLNAKTPRRPTGRPVGRPPLSDTRLREDLARVRDKYMEHARSTERLDDRTLYEEYVDVIDSWLEHGTNDDDLVDHINERMHTIRETASPSVAEDDYGDDSGDDQYRRDKRHDPDPISREAEGDCWAYTEESDLPPEDVSDLRW